MFSLYLATKRSIFWKSSLLRQVKVGDELKFGTFLRGWHLCGYVYSKLNGEHIELKIHYSIKGALWNEMVMASLRKLAMISLK